MYIHIYLIYVYTYTVYTFVYYAYMQYASAALLKHKQILQTRLNIKPTLMINCIGDQSLGKITYVCTNNSTVPYTWIAHIQSESTHSTSCSFAHHEISQKKTSIICEFGIANNTIF